MYNNLMNLCSYGFVTFDGTKLFSISGASGSGKGELIKHIRREYGQHIHFSVSHTTRPRRHNESDGIDYHFVTRDKFMELAEAGAFLECKEVHGNWYGTSKEPLWEATLSGKFALLDIDVQGVAEIRPSLPLGAFFFLQTPMEILKQRLRKRQETTGEVDAHIEKRLQNATEEVRLAQRIFDPEEFIESITADTLEAGVTATAAALMQKLDDFAGTYWMPLTRRAAA
jgi:guanylate kinase